MNSFMLDISSGRALIIDGQLTRHGKKCSLESIGEKHLSGPVFEKNALYPGLRAI